MLHAFLLQQLCGQFFNYSQNVINYSPPYDEREYRDELESLFESKFEFRHVPFEA